ncbi:hypothetical protein BDW69DRAFT_187933 [Aspergillus filifer]
MEPSATPIHRLPTELFWDIFRYLAKGNVLDFAITSQQSLSLCKDYIQNAQEEYKSQTILEWVGLCGGYTTVRRPLLQSSGRDNRDLDALQRLSILVDASEAGDVVKVKALLKDVSPNPPAHVTDTLLAPDVRLCVTPLEAAMYKNHHEIIELLLDAGAEVRPFEDMHLSGQMFFFMPETEDSTIRLLLNHPRTQNIEWQRRKLAKLACSMRYNVSLISRLMRVGLWSDETDYPTPVGKSLLTDWYGSSAAYHDVRRFLLSD